MLKRKKGAKEAPEQEQDSVVKEGCEAQAESAEDIVAEAEGEAAEAETTAEEPAEEDLELSPEAARIQELEAENAEAKDRFLRLQAEYENFRKRSASELQRRYEDALVDVAKAWLPVLDNLDRAEAAAAELESKEAEQVAQGIELVKRQALETMAEFGVEEIATVGEKFDPEWHEALHHIEDQSFGENEISQLFTKGYKKGERVLRHAQVQVAN